MLVAPMRLARQAGAVLLWAATMSRGLFAQSLPASPDSMRLRGVELRYVLPEPLFDNTPAAEPIKAVYVNAWAFGSNKLEHLVRLADSTEINAFVVDVKDRKSTRLNSSHQIISYAVFCLKKKKIKRASA